MLGARPGGEPASTGGRARRPSTRVAYMAYEMRFVRIPACRRAMLVQPMSAHRAKRRVPKTLPRSNRAARAADRDGGGGRSKVFVTRLRHRAHEALIVTHPHVSPACGRRLGAGGVSGVARDRPGLRVARNRRTIVVRRASRGRAGSVRRRLDGELFREPMRRPRYPPCARDPRLAPVQRLRPHPARRPATPFARPARRRPSFACASRAHALMRRAGRTFDETRGIE